MFGLIVSRSWNGEFDSGDSLAETRIWFLKKLCNIEDDLRPFNEIIGNLKNAGGAWIRSPYRWTDPTDMSRDQLDPAVMSMCIYEMDVKNEFTNIVRNWFRYPNGDLCGPEHIGHFYRRTAKPWLRGLFYISDFFTLVNALIICFRNTEDCANDLNHIISLCYAQYFGGTVISRLAARIYLKYRDYNLALLNYYNPKTGNGDLIAYYLKGLDWLRKTT